MRIYLDTCSVNRPLDDKSQPRIALEAEAVLAILDACEDGVHTLISSDILMFEVGRNPHIQRRTLASEIIANAGDVILLTESIRQRAKVFEQAGLKSVDALHLASADSGNVDYFCTCDDSFYKRAKARSDLRVRVFTPLELAQELFV